MIQLKRVSRASLSMNGAANDNVLVGAAWATAPAWLRADALRKATAPKGRKDRFKGVAFNEKK